MGEDGKEGMGEEREPRLFGCCLRLQDLEIPSKLILSSSPRLQAVSLARHITACDAKVSRKPRRPSLLPGRNWNERREKRKKPSEKGREAESYARGRDKTAVNCEWKINSGWRKWMKKVDDSGDGGSWGLSKLRLCELDNNSFPWWKRFVFNIIRSSSSSSSSFLLFRIFHFSDFIPHCFSRPIYSFSRPVTFISR